MYSSCSPSKCFGCRLTWSSSKCFLIISSSNSSHPSAGYIAGRSTSPRRHQQPFISKTSLISSIPLSVLENHKPIEMMMHMCSILYFASIQLNRFLKQIWMLVLIVCCRYGLIFLNLLVFVLMSDWILQR